MINGADECVHTSVFHTRTEQGIQRFLLTQVNQFTFQLRADDDCFRSEMVPRIIRHSFSATCDAVAGGADPGIRALSSALAVAYSGGYRSQIRFGHVTGEDRRL